MYLRNLVLVLSMSMVAACTGDDNLTATGQLIECDVATNGATSNCAPVSEPSGDPNTCVDIDDDGDDSPDDDDDDDDGDDDSSLTGDTDDDDDGTPDSDDDDDDNDGLDDEVDCDELPGGDDDDAED